MTFPEIFAKEKRVDARSVTAHDRLLIIVGENLRLDEIARAEQIGDRPRFARGAKGALAKAFLVADVRTLQFFAAKRRNLITRAKPKVARHIDAIETGKRAHADVVKLREQKCIDEVPAIDVELRLIDGFLRDLKSRRA